MHRVYTAHLVPVQCQKRNAVITQVHETRTASEQIQAETTRLEAQVTRINKQINKNNIDPNTPMLVEFMESAVDDQLTFLMKELFKEHSKLVDITALSDNNAFVVSSVTTVATLAAMHSRYTRVATRTFVQGGLSYVYSTLCAFPPLCKRSSTSSWVWESSAER